MAGTVFGKRPDFCGGLRVRSRRARRRLAALAISHGCAARHRARNYSHFATTNADAKPLSSPRCYERVRQIIATPAGTGLRRIA
jgi:hypothetical protein